LVAEVTKLDLSDWKWEQLVALGVYQRAVLAIKEGRIGKRPGDEQ
jgi:hypothetical protein